MSAPVLTLNAGSSSLKFALFGAAEDRPVLTGLVDRIGGDAWLFARDGAGGKQCDAALAPDHARRGHAGAVRAVLELIETSQPGLRPSAVGHRIVHGGPDRAVPERLDDALLHELAQLSPFAPLHQPHNLAGVIAARAAFPDVPQIGCFDTAFHRNQPFVEDAFALPRRYFDKGVRRYGFHGLSYDYIAGHLAAEEPALAKGRVIVAHLGNGASICATRGGVSVASTMGFSALDGLAMGTRCGQIDPGVLLYMLEQEGLDADQVSDILYRESGLKGLSGLSNDLRVLEAAGSCEAEQAIEYFTHRIRREIAALAAVLGGCDALVFTAGIGEHSARVRAECCADMRWMGLAINPETNTRHEREIGASDSKIRVLVIPTNEELVIARAARALI